MSNADHPNSPRHAHLKAQWQPGQKWETLVENCTQWVPVSDGGRAEPTWDHRQEYRQMEPEAPQRRIVCAAIRAADGEVLLGICHYSMDMHRQIEARRDGEKFAHRNDEDQGFVDQHGVYVTREEAYAIAAAARQIVHPRACGDGLAGPKLYSEGLY